MFTCRDVRARRGLVLNTYNKVMTRTRRTKPKRMVRPPTPPRHPRTYSSSSSTSSLNDSVRGLRIRWDCPPPPPPVLVTNVVDGKCPVVRPVIKYAAISTHAPVPRS